MYIAVGYLEDLPGFMFSLKTLNAIQSFFLSTMKMAMTPVNTSSKATVPMTAAPLDSLTSRIGRNVFAPKHLTDNLLDRKIIQFKKYYFLRSITIRSITIHTIAIWCPTLPSFTSL